jgi:hypothetical protein
MRVFYSYVMGITFGILLCLSMMFGWWYAIPLIGHAWWSWRTLK